ncbi:MAG: polysaccharide biosynthesis C-terminal domain-containing protein [Oscillospiraceae bacterium]|nr:polysaccharide biosynthesis C-terminal domain-containing protein [Oscillospiraceae bacterium]
MAKRSSILGGALLLTAVNLLLRLISIGFNVFLTDRIGAAGLGLLQLIYTVGMFAMLAGTGGIRVASMCLTAEEFGHRRSGGVRLAMRTSLRWGVLVSGAAGAALCFLSAPIASILLRDLRTVPALQVMGLFLPFSCLCGIMTGYFTACSRIRQMVGVEIAERLISVLLTVGMLVFWAKDDLARACCAILLGSGLGSVFDFFLLFFLYRRQTRAEPIAGSRADMRRRLRQLCVPLALNDVLRAGLTAAEHFLIPFGLARYAGTEQALADYGTIHAMVFPVLMFPAAVLYAVSDLLVPELSRCRAMGRSLRIVDLTDKCLRMTALFSAAAAGFFFLNADALGQTVYGSPDAGYYLRCFAPAALMLYLDAITDGMLKGLAQQVSCVRYNTVTSLLDVILLLALLPRWGVGGYLFSFVVTHAINLFLSLRRLLLISGHQPQASDFFRPLSCLLCAALPSALLRGAVTRSVVFFLLLLGFFLLSDALSARDRQWLRGISFDRRKKLG